jgi:hypothetical protein
MISMIADFATKFRQNNKIMLKDDWISINKELLCQKTNHFLKNDNTTTPGHSYFEYGANREGYWNCELSAQPLFYYMECVEFLYPEYQRIVFELDWSSGHMKFNENALVATNLNANHGGKQPTIMRDSIITSECQLGEGATLKVGDIQQTYFMDDNAPLQSRCFKD